jgi:hypothetical protein
VCNPKSLPYIVQLRQDRSVRARMQLTQSHFAPALLAFERHTLCPISPRYSGSSLKLVGVFNVFGSKARQAAELAVAGRSMPSITATFPVRGVRRECITGKHDALCWVSKHASRSLRSYCLLVRKFGCQGQSSLSCDPCIELCESVSASPD